MFSLLLCPVATRTLRYCPCCAIHVCDRCCSFPAGTILLLRAAFLISISYKGISFSSDKQLPISPINVGVPETQQSADTALGWRGSLAVAVSAVSLQAGHRLQPLLCPSCQSDCNGTGVQQLRVGEVEQAGLTCWLSAGSLHYFLFSLSLL